MWKYGITKRRTWLYERKNNKKGVPEKLKYNSKISVNRLKIKLRKSHRKYSKKRNFIHQNCLNANYVSGTVLGSWNISYHHHQQQ